jgi:hypothetical protein
MAIIGINGYASVGKDLVGKIIQWLTARKAYPNFVEPRFEDFLKEYDGKDKVILYVDQGGPPLTSPFEIKKFAGKLKQVASILTGITIKMFEDQEFKKTYLGSEWSTAIRKPGKRQDGLFGGELVIKPMSVRDLLQKLGTEALRNGLHENTWVNALMADYTIKTNWVITDTRFPNEAEAIKQRDGIILTITNPDVSPVNRHVSETALDNYPFDHVIVNDGKDLGSLIKSVEEFLIKFNFISHGSS